MTGQKPHIEATLTSKGQITIPQSVRSELGIATGDKIEFHKLKGGGYRISSRKRRSILDLARERPLPRLERPFQNADIDEAVDAAMADRERRSKPRRPRK